MAVSVESLGDGQGGNISSFSFDHTIGGANRHAIIAIATDGSTASSVTVGAVTCSLITGCDATVGSVRIQIFETDSEPATGTVTVAGTLSAMEQSIVMSVNFQGVDTTGPTSGGTSNTVAAGTSLGISVTSATGDFVVDAIRSDAAPTEDASQASVFTQTQAGRFHEGSSEAGAASVAMDWTFATADAALAGFSLAAAPVTEALQDVIHGMGIIPWPR